MADVKITRQEIISLCRLCLAKDLASIDIFETNSEVRQLFTKIVACLPIQVTTGDSLPHKICEVCNSKVDDFYQFWTSTAKNQKQLNDWLEISTDEDQKTVVPTIKVEADDTRQDEEYDDYDDGGRGDDSDDDEDTPIAAKRIKTQDSGDEDQKPTDLDAILENSTDVNGKKDGSSKKKSKEKQSGSNKVEIVSADEWRALRKNKTTTCPICKKSYPSARNMRKHLKRCHIDKKPSIKIPPKNLECIYCNAKFTDKVKLEEHISNHSDVNKFTCDLCNKHFTCMKSLKLHLVHHERKRKLAENEEFVVDTGDITLEEWNDLIKRRVRVCPKCNKDYRTPRNMRKHLRRVHTTERKYGCEVCGKMLKSSDSLTMHKRIQHQGVKLPKTCNYECHYCGAKYANKYALSDHISAHTGISNHVCQICGKGYSNAASLRMHNIKVHLQFTGVHIEKFKCDICDKEFFEKKKLNKHKNWAHGDKFHLCKVCGAKIKGSLKQHMVTHTGERKICCHICGKKLRGKLKEHLLTHTGERPHACEVCGGTFKNKWYLTVHMRTHNGIRPYNCDYCGQKFAARSCYTAHLKKHTDMKKKKPTPSSDGQHQCQLCRLSFISEEGLNEHIRKHFGV